jgi:hypothetical protein
MRKVLLQFLIAIIFPYSIAHANNIVVPSDAVSLAELEQAATQNADTPCATKIWADQLAQTAQNVDESAPEEVIQQWIYDIFYDGQTLTRVLECPELVNLADDDPIRFTPIQYTFPNGRLISINYETQPKIIKQRISMANKRGLPSSDPNPRIGANDDPTVWTNTEPAWYGIMVVESGALNAFVGPNKNNTISLKYINNNIDALYPAGMNCTTKHALARNNKAINRATTKTVGIDGDSNDYYVAGDANLEWIGYVEVATDVILTVTTLGGGVVISGGLKGIRATKTMRDLSKSLGALRKLDSVRDYIKTSGQVTKLTKEIATLDKVKDAAKIADKTAELDKIKDALKTIENSDDVKKYIKQADAYSDLQKYRKTLQGARAITKQAKRGNVFTRGVKLIKATHAAFNGNKILAKGAKAARASKLSTRVKDWLFHSTLKNASTLAKMTASTGLLYGTLKFVGNMYDFTETSTGDFTNNVDFKPLLLLSADDIKGQENVVNYGMWLMWAGDSMNPADDDAAYLQAMDFAAKFHEDLMEVQNDTNSPCNVDIYVVRPVLRGIDTDTSELYYLIMNDTPWTTNQ